MSKATLVRLADDWPVVVVSYFCALLPLTCMYAIDHMNENWRTIRRTRRQGKMYIFFSLPPLALVIFYTHLQRLMPDYKEMSMAITATILCIWTIFRSIWGLIQLHAFKQWNMHALHVLVRMGFDAPIYFSRSELRRLRSSGAISTEREPEAHRAAESQDSARAGNLRKWISKGFSLLTEGCQKLFNIEKLQSTMLSELRPARNRSQRPFQLTMDHIERTVDYHVRVNNTLADNEFWGADLPCSPNWSVFLAHIFSEAVRFMSPWRILYPSRKTTPSYRAVTCWKTEKCAVRWAVSFLARFGEQWLIETKRLANFSDMSAADSASEIVRDDISFRCRLAAFIAFNITQEVNVESDETNRYSGNQQVSILSPHHVMCSDLQETWHPTLKVTERNALPYQVPEDTKALPVKEYATCITDSISSWHKEELDRSGAEKRSAVLDMNAYQVACFLKLMEERNSDILPFSEEGAEDIDFNMQPASEADTDSSDIALEQTRFRIFHWQLGCDTQQENSGNELMDQLYDASPVLRKSFKPFLWPGEPTSVLQASVHLDNWVSFQAGDMLFDNAQAQPSISDDAVRVDMAQENIELGRLQLRVANSPDLRVLENTNFLGCVMAFVLRSVTPGTRTNLNPSIPVHPFSFSCSEQLNQAMEDAHFGRISEQRGEGNSTELRSLHMRLVLEMQLSLLRAGDRSSDSISSMITCMLAYPSLRFSAVDQSDQGDHPPFAVAEESDQGDHPHVAVPIESCDISVAEEIETHGQSEGGSVLPVEREEDVHQGDHPHVAVPIESCDISVAEEIETHGQSEGGSVLHVEREEDEHIKAVCFEEEEVDVNLSKQKLKHAKPKRVSYKIHIPCAPQPLFLFFEWNSVSREIFIQIGKDDDGISCWSWQKWRDGFMGRMSAQRKWRSSRLRFKTEIIREEAIKPLDIAEVSMPLDGLEWYPFPSQRCVPLVQGGFGDEMDESWRCYCGCKAQKEFERAKYLAANRRALEAIEIFGLCIMDYGHSRALDCCVSAAINLFPENKQAVDKLLYFMSIGINLAHEGRFENKCLMFQIYDIEKLIKLFEIVYDKTLDTRALYYRGQTLFLQSQKENTFGNLCFESLESHIILENSRLELAAASRFCLALCFFWRYSQTGQISDAEIGRQHMRRISESGLRKSKYHAGLEELALAIAFLLKKGFLSERECGRFGRLDQLHTASFLHGVHVQSVLRNVLLWSHNTYRAPPLDGPASSAIFSSIEVDGKPSQPTVLNRLALMYQTEADTAKNRYKAYRLYKRAIREGPPSPHMDTQSINAMCNLGVWYGQKSAKDSADLFKRAIEECERRDDYKRTIEAIPGLEREEGQEEQSHEHHSTSMNNLAVLMESGELRSGDFSRSASDLYQKAVEIDENPVAMYNWAVFLKLEDPTSENLEEAERLFKRLNDLKQDLQSMPMLNSQVDIARSLSPTGITTAIPFDVDEIDDCLAYVKIVGNLDSGK